MSRRHIINPFLFICYISSALCYFLLTDKFINLANIADLYSCWSILLINSCVTLFLLITSLYTKIPIIETLNIIKDYVNNDDQFTRKTAIPQDKFLHLVHLVLTTTWYTFNSQFYQQTDDICCCLPKYDLIQLHHDVWLVTCLGIVTFYCSDSIEHCVFWPIVY